VTTITIGCQPTQCDRLHTADFDLRLALSRRDGERPTKFVRERFIVCWSEGLWWNHSTDFPCVGQAEQWARKHLAEHLRELHVTEPYEIVKETAFYVREVLETRDHVQAGDDTLWNGEMAKLVDHAREVRGFHFWSKEA
jgi:hypothetical protein